VAGLHRRGGDELSEGALVHAAAVLAALCAVSDTASLFGSGLQIDGGVSTPGARPLLTAGAPAEDLVGAVTIDRASRLAALRVEAAYRCR